MNGANSKNSEGVSSMLYGALKGLVISIIAAIILITVLTLVIYMMPDPDKYLKPASILSLFLSAAIGGIAAVKGTDKGAVTGLISGLFLLIIVLIISAFDPDSKSSYGPLVTGLLYAAVPLVSFMSALLFGGMGKKEKRPKFKKRKR